MTRASAGVQTLYVPSRYSACASNGCTGCTRPSTSLVAFADVSTIGCVGAFQVGQSLQQNCKMGRAANRRREPSQSSSRLTWYCDVSIGCFAEPAQAYTNENEAHHVVACAFTRDSSIVMVACWAYIVVVFVACCASVMPAAQEPLEQYDEGLLRSTAHETQKMRVQTTPCIH